MIGTVRPSAEVDWLLDELVAGCRGVRSAVVLSDDGLAIGRSTIPQPSAGGTPFSRADADHLAAVSSGFHSLAKGTGRHFAAGSVRQTMVELEEAFLFVVAAGDGTCLAVLTDTGTDLGQVAYEMARLIRRVGEHLRSGPRTGPGSDAGSAPGRGSGVPPAAAPVPVTEPATGTDAYRKL
jgi:predicted regulator of Ras-like GTPase activity (Roadblock/LC7/MglB family)